MSKYYKLGDKIEIKYKVDDIELSDTSTITYYHQDGYIYTCGHCFPKNALFDLGNLVYSSGFDTIDENKEIAIIKIKPEYQYKFRPIILNNIIDNNCYNNKKATLIHMNKTYFGKIIAKINRNLPKGKYKLGTSEIFNHSITKLEPPYYLVKHDNIEVKHGLSGSPWKVYDKEFKLLGTHIGKVKTNNNKFISYVKPIKNIL